jgi:hypothetical protein
MQRIMFSGESSVRECPQAEKTSQWQQLRPKPSAPVSGHVDRDESEGNIHLEPDEDEISKAGHGKLGGSQAAPCARVLNRDNMHDPHERCHREQ